MNLCFQSLFCSLIVQYSIFAERLSTTSIETKYDKIIEILSEHRLMLNELLENHRRIKSPLPSITFDLPLETLENINTLEEKLEDKKILALFVKDMENVGGNGPKNFINRLMKVVFTNQLGELCSWTGAKHNFRINNLQVMAALYHVVHKKYEVSQKDFEVHVRDWLKNAKQRRVREDNKDKIILTPIQLPKN